MFSQLIHDEKYIIAYVIVIIFIILNSYKTVINNFRFNISIHRIQNENYKIV